jgi:hypothetical protein
MRIAKASTGSNDVYVGALARREDSSVKPRRNLLLLVALLDFLPDAPIIPFRPSRTRKRRSSFRAGSVRMSS